MKTFEYWSLKYQAQPFSLYLHNRIGLSKGVTLFVGVIIQENENWGYFDSSYEFAKEWHGVTKTEYSQTLKWLKSQSFADISIVYDYGCRLTYIKIDFVKFNSWLQTDTSFCFEMLDLTF
jgi:hypothetical protein